jgi:hypothetical protein
MPRNGNKWTVNELLALQREYELLGLSVQEIAQRHERSVTAIQYRLVDEGFATWDDLEGSFNNHDECSDECLSDTESQVSKLADRVWSLETSVSDISAMVKQMFTSMVSSKTATPSRSSLRSGV